MVLYTFGFIISNCFVANAHDLWTFVGVFMQLEDYFECFVFNLNIKLYYNGLLNIRTQLTLVIILNAFLSGRKQKTTINHSEQDIDLAMVKTVCGVSLKPRIPKLKLFRN